MWMKRSAKSLLLNFLSSWQRKESNYCAASKHFPKESERNLGQYIFEYFVNLNYFLHKCSCFFTTLQQDSNWAKWLNCFSASLDPFLLLTCPWQHSDTTTGTDDVTTVMGVTNEGNMCHLSAESPDTTTGLRSVTSSSMWKTSLFRPNVIHQRATVQVSNIAATSWVLFHCDYVRNNISLFLF